MAYGKEIWKLNEDSSFTTISTHSDHFYGKSFLLIQECCSSTYGQMTQKLNFKILQAFNVRLSQPPDLQEAKTDNGNIFSK